MSKILVGLISPFRGKDKEDHINNIQKATLWQLEHQIDGMVPVVPHLIFQDILDDFDLRQRTKGIRMGHELYEECLYCEVHTWGSNQNSEGMWEDIKFCESKGIKLRYYVD